MLRMVSSGQKESAGLRRATQDVVYGASTILLPKLELDRLKRRDYIQLQNSGVRIRNSE
jgi:hypothetical protein